MISGSQNNNLNVSVNGFIDNGERVENNKSHKNLKDIFFASLDLLEISPQFSKREKYDKQAIFWNLRSRFNLDKMGDRFYNCRKNFLVLDCLICKKEYVAIPNSCNVRICDKCRLKAYYKIRDKYASIVLKMHNPKLLTLTWKNILVYSPSFLNKMVKDFNNFLRRKVIKKRVFGGIVVKEVKNIGKGWNIHLHILIDMAYTDQDLISKTWEKVTKNSPIVDIRSIFLYKKGMRIPYHRLNIEDKQLAKLQAFNYILKYLKKKPDLMNNFQYALYLKTSYNRRLINTFGYFYKLRKTNKRTFLECSKCGGGKWVSMGIFQDWELLEFQVRYLSFNGDVKGLDIPPPIEDN